MRWIVRIPKAKKSLRKQFSLDTFGDYVKITEYIDSYVPFKILFVGTFINLQFFINLRLNFNNWRSSKFETRHFVSLETWCKMHWKGAHYWKLYVIILTKRFSSWPTEHGRIGKYMFNSFHCEDSVGEIWSPLRKFAPH